MYPTESAYRAASERSIWWTRLNTMRMCLEISINTVPTMVHNVCVCTPRMLCAYCAYISLLLLVFDDGLPSAWRCQAVVPVHWYQSAVSDPESSRACFVSRIRELLSLFDRLLANWSAKLIWFAVNCWTTLQATSHFGWSHFDLNTLTAKLLATAEVSSFFRASYLTAIHVLLIGDLLCYVLKPP